MRSQEASSLAVVVGPLCTVIKLTESGTTLKLELTCKSKIYDIDMSSGNNKRIRATRDDFRIKKPQVVLNSYEDYRSSFSFFFFFEFELCQLRLPLSSHGGLYWIVDPLESCHCACLSLCCALVWPYRCHCA